MQVLKIDPVSGSAFGTSEKKIHLGFFSACDLPNFAFAYAFGRAKAATLKQKTLSQFDKEQGPNDELAA